MVFAESARALSATRRCVASTWSDRAEGDRSFLRRDDPAYQVVGDGPVDLVWAPGTVSHLDLDWEQLGPMIDRFSSFCRLIRFDKRGTGLSDRPLRVATLDERIDDIRAVMDAVGSEQAALLGWSEGASMACLFAATYPQRTRCLVLWGVQARWVQTDDYPWGLTPEEHRRLIEDGRENWPSIWYLTGPGSGAPKDIPPAVLEMMMRNKRAGASPAAAARRASRRREMDRAPHAVLRAGRACARPLRRR